MGTNILRKEWDALIILDACRVDALKQVQDEYGFISKVDSYWSVGSTSKEWLINTFLQEHKEVINNVAMVTGNGWTEKIFMGDVEWGRWTATNDSYWDGHPISSIIKRKLVSSDDFHSFIPVWGEDYSKSDNRAPRAESVTDAAISTARDKQPDKLLVHYMQPHEPYFGFTPPDEELTERDLQPLDALRKGANHSEIWERYIENLRYVLDSVERLLNSINAERVIITADHGELFGELGLYGHVAALPHPALRKVPWVVTEAEDSGNYQPELKQGEIESGDVNERLSDLGYI